MIMRAGAGRALVASPATKAACAATAAVLAARIAMASLFDSRIALLYRSARGWFATFVAIPVGRATLLSGGAAGTPRELQVAPPQPSISPASIRRAIDFKRVCNSRLASDAFGCVGLPFSLTSLPPT